MNSTTKILVSILAAAALAGCASSGFNATYDHDPAQDFSSYRTFAWISANPMKIGPSVQSPNPLLEPRIMSAVETALAAKGYGRVDAADAADFVVSFTVGSRDDIRVNSYPSMSMGYSAGYPSHWRWGASYYCCASDTDVRHYTKGILAIDVFDVKDHRPVWHGVASKTISEKDRKNIEATVNAAVDAILAGFPPQ